MKIIKKLKTCVKKIMLKKGFKTNRHIVVFESDDWGATRISNKDNLNKLKSLYSNVNFDHYQSLDTLETDNDVRSLLDILKRHKDCKGNHAKFTLNFATQNPDFEKIQQNGYKQIYLESIVDSYQKGNNTQNVLNIVKNGIAEKVFLPQLHSREHFNSQFLLDDLCSQSLVKDAFNLGIIGVAQDNYCALDTLNSSPENNQKLLNEAYADFEKIFNYKSRTFIAPCYVWSKCDETTLHQLGVEGLQAKIFQNLPKGRNSYKKVFHKFGSTSKDTQLIYTARNCFFEPARDIWNNIDEEKIIDNTLKEIEFAFSCNKPAIICCHRVNFASNISNTYCEKTLKLLDNLLTKLENQYNDLEYMFSTELLDTIKEKK